MRACDGISTALMRFFQTLRLLINFHMPEQKILSSNFLGHSRADDLLRCFPEVTFKLELDKTLQVSMGEPSVNLKFYKKLVKSQEISELHAVASTLLMGLPNLVPCHLSGIL